MKQKPHPLCRPPRLAKSIEVFRLAANGRWSKDDGRPAEAFIALVPTNIFKVRVPTVYAPRGCTCSYGDCPTKRAADEACDRWDSAAIEYRRPIR